MVPSRPRMRLDSPRHRSVNWVLVSCVLGSLLPHVSNALKLVDLLLDRRARILMLSTRTWNGYDARKLV